MQLELDDATISYQLSGEGRPLVVSLHGLFASRRTTADQDLDLTERLHDRTILSYDARGHGESSSAPVAEAFTWARLADDLVALLDAVGADGPVDAIGASMGTGTILHAVVAHPERFRRLVLVIPPTAWETRVAQRDVYLQGARLIRARGFEAFVSATSVALPPPPAMADRDWITVPAIAEDLLPTVIEGAAASDLPSPEQIATITAPTLLLPWTGDPGHPLSTAERLAELLPDSRTVVARTPADRELWRRAVAEHLGD